MKLLLEKQWIISMVSLLFSVSIALYVEYTGTHPSYLWSTAVIILSGITLLLNHSVLSFRVICFAIIAFPALSPFYSWFIMEKELFSQLATNLQHNAQLVNKVTFLFAAAAVCYTSIAAPTQDDIYTANSTGTKKSVNIPDPVLYLIAILTLFSCYIIDPGPTILTTGYNAILSSRFESNSLIVLIITSFGGLWSMLFIFGRHKTILFWGVTLLVFIWLLLHARRVELSGISLVLILHYRHHLKPRILILLISTLLLTLILTGIVRDKGIVKYLQKSITTAPSHIKTKKAALPGGASNVFIAGLHLVNVKDEGLLDRSEELTMLQWPRSLIPNFFLRALKRPATQNEHELIYKKLNLHYLGGMPLLTVYYLNGGIILVLTFGAIHAALSRKIDSAIKRNALRFNNNYKQIFGILIASVFLVYQFRYHWYNPQTMFRAVETALFLFLIFTALSTLIRRYLGGQEPPNIDPVID